MTPRDERRTRSSWLPALSGVARALTSGEVADRTSDAGRARLLATFRRARSHGISGAAWGGAGLLAAGVASTPLLVPAAAPASLRAPHGNGYVSGGRGASATVQLALGSNVELTPGSRGRVADPEEGPTRMILEAGRARVRGQARSSGELLVEAGPYALVGHGAAFDVSWSGSEIEVRVDAGTVTVEGPAVVRELTLHENQTFAAREAEWELGCF